MKVHKLDILRFCYAFEIEKIICSVGGLSEIENRKKMDIRENVGRYFYSLNGLAYQPIVLKLYLYVLCE
jgi:hypothetical protein